MAIDIETSSLEFPTSDGSEWVTVSVDEIACGELVRCTHLGMQVVGALQTFEADEAARAQLNVPYFVDRADGPPLYLSRLALEKGRAQLEQRLDAQAQQAESQLAA